MLQTLRVLGAASVLLLLSAAAAVAQSTGSIQGTVTLPAPPTTAVTSRPSILVYDANGAFVKSVTVPAPPGGPYSIDGLAAGIYYLHAHDFVWLSSDNSFPGSGYYTPQLYGGSGCVNDRCRATSGTPVTVAAGTATTGIDFTLEVGASITGSITPAFIAADDHLELYDSNGIRVQRIAKAFDGAASGSTSFAARGLIAGVYFLRTVSQSYLDEAYDGAPCEGCPPLTGTPIILAAGESRSIGTIDLAPAPLVTGIVTDASTGQGIPNVFLELHAADGRRVAITGTGSASGTFTLPAAPGTYSVRAHSNEAAFADALLEGIVVTESGKSGVTLPMARGVRLVARIIGDGVSLLGGASATVFDSSGTAVARAVTSRTSNEIGVWGLTLPPGTYYLRSDPYSGSVQRLYKDKPCPRGTCDPRTGTPIELTSPLTFLGTIVLPVCAGPRPAMLSSTQTGATVGVAYQLRLFASRVSPGAFSLVSGVLPPGVALDTATGVISGTPVSTGSFTFTVAQVDDAGCATTGTYTVHVSACSTIVGLSTTAFIPTAPGPGLVRIVTGPDYFAMPAAGGREDISLLGTCAPSAVFGAATVSGSWLRVTGPNVINGQPQPSGRIEVDPNPSATEFRTGYVVLNGRTITVRQAPISSASPFGGLDYPLEGSINRGPVPLGGWALDDLGVTRVRIFRDPVAPEPAGALVYIGDGTFVKGARPDVAAAFPSVVGSDRAGWGYLLLTNVLPNQGNGTYRLSVFADDGEGHSTLLGARTIVADNARLTIPFGSIDTPPEGATISGSAYPNFGWALTPRPKTIPKDGSTIQVHVDGQFMGLANYNHFRQDVFDTFPALANSGGAVGFRSLDTTKLTDGMHTISWLVTDDAGAAAGLGSRYFTVQNNSASAALVAAPAVPAASLAALGVRDAPARIIRPLERMTVRLAAADDDRCISGYSGYDATSGELRDLPVGSSLDAKNGTFYWQPGPGFAGTYQMIFIRTLCDGVRERIPVSISIVPAG